MRNLEEVVGNLQAEVFELRKKVIETNEKEKTDGAKLDSPRRVNDLL